MATNKLCRFSLSVNVLSETLLTLFPAATTLNYLSRYNKATMVTNNSKLLSTIGKIQKETEQEERLTEMDQEKFFI